MHPAANVTAARSPTPLDEVDPFLADLMEAGLVNAGDAEDSKEERAPGAGGAAVAALPTLPPQLASAAPQLAVSTSPALRSDGFDGSSVRSATEAAPGANTKAQAGWFSTPLPSWGSPLPSLWQSGNEDVKPVSMSCELFWRVHCSVWTPVMCRHSCTSGCDHCGPSCPRCAALHRFRNSRYASHVPLLLLCVSSYAPLSLTGPRDRRTVQERTNIAGRHCAPARR